MKKQVGFLLLNKALSTENFLYWFKPVAEIKKKTKKQPKPNQQVRNAFCLVGNACSVGCAAGDTLPPRVHKAHQQPTLRAPPRTAVGWKERSDTHTAIQLCPDICAVITPLLRGSEEKHSQISYFYSSPLSCIRNCCPIHRICCQVVPAMAVPSEQIMFGKQNT